jgi:CheY-like chemotaxis protein
VVKVRIHHVEEPPARFNVLLTQDRAHPDEHWTRQLPRLLQPQGINAYVARSGREAMTLVAQLQIHAAVIDLATPMDEVLNKGASAAAAAEAAGLKLLELFHRLPNHPPMVVVHRPAYTREADRMLREALRLGAFSVLHKPVEVEQILAVFRRLLDRRYHGTWPKPFPGAPGASDTRPPGNGSDSPPPRPGPSAN